MHHKEAGTVPRARLVCAEEGEEPGACQEAAVQHCEEDQQRAARHKHLRSVTVVRAGEADPAGLCMRRQSPASGRSLALGCRVVRGCCQYLEIFITIEAMHSTYSPALLDSQPGSYPMTSK